MRVPVLFSPVSTRRRFDVDTTLLQRQNDVMCLLGISLSHGGKLR